MEYKVQIKNVKRFTIEMGLRPGYDVSAQPCTEEYIIDCYLDWQKDRIAKNLENFPGIVSGTNFVYAHKGSDKVIATHEPAVRIEGEIEVSPDFKIDNQDNLILEDIFSLARNLGSKAKQKRVHVMYADRSFVLEGE